jgi:biopolymer transport protein ExbD
MISAPFPSRPLCSAHELVLAFALTLSAPAWAGQPEATPAQQRLALVVDVPNDGDVTVRGKPYKDSELDELFRAAIARDKDLQLVVQAHKDTPHARVVAVLDHAKTAGFTKIAIATAR